MTLMWCRDSIFVEKSTIDFPIFLLLFNTKLPIFPISSSILSFLFSYLFEQPYCGTPCIQYPNYNKYKTLTHTKAITAIWIDLWYVYIIVLTADVTSCFSGIDYSSPWRDNFNASRESIRQNLHILHPSMQTILGICQSKNYSTMLITDQSNLRYCTQLTFCFSFTF